MTNRKSFGHSLFWRNSRACALRSSTGPATFATFMAYDKALEKRIRRFFEAKRINHEAKRMMGGLCFMVKGKMCVGVEKNRLMARIGPEAYEDALTRKGCRPMDFTGRPMRGFVFVEFDGLKSDK